MDLYTIFVLVAFISLLTSPTQSGGVTFLDGDVYIEGVISLYSPKADGSCGEEVDPEVVQNIESVRWTLMKLNENAAVHLFGKQIGEFQSIYYIFLKILFRKQLNSND